jgi:hypothetical protein
MRSSAGVTSVSPQAVAPSTPASSSVTETVSRACVRTTTVPLLASANVTSMRSAQSPASTPVALVTGIGSPSARRK